MPWYFFVSFFFLFFLFLNILISTPTTTAKHYNPFSTPCEKKTHSTFASSTHKHLACIPPTSTARWNPPAFSARCKPSSNDARRLCHLFVSGQPETTIHRLNHLNHLDQHTRSNTFFFILLILYIFFAFFVALRIPFPSWMDFLRLIRLWNHRRSVFDDNIFHLSFETWVV